LRNKRYLVIYFCFLGAFVVLLGRLGYIQLINGPIYTRQAVAQRQHTIDYVQYHRGRILDRHLRNLTNVEKQPCAVVFPIMVQDFAKTANYLGEVLCLAPETITAKLGSQGKRLNNVVQKPFILKANLNDREIQEIQNAKLPGVFVLPLISRYRPDTPAVHTLGYVGQISKNEYQKMEHEKQEYNLTDIIGKSGIEKQYENYLRGSNGKEVAALIDERGRLLQGKGFTLLPEDKRITSKNHNIVLTIDAHCQRIVEQEMEGYSGAAVVMDVTNGDILALASSPKFDPYLLGPISSNDAYVNKVLKNYPPASVFKIVLAAGALEEGIVCPEDIFNCSGHITIPSGRNVSCWKPDGHGQISFAQALAHSCNPVFIETGLKLGGELIMNYALKFGLNDDSIIGYSTVSYNHFDFNYSVPGDIANVSIGEKGIMLSPVLVAKLYSQVANGGFGITPRLVLKIQDSTGHTVKNFFSPASKRIISSKTAQELKLMLQSGVREGTGKSAQVPGIEVAGKTGSSETHGVWFAGFAPVQQPRWAVVVFLQKGSSGGREAAPIFKKIVSQLIAEENNR
jgi:penicillin-binding protein 2